MSRTNAALFCFLFILLSACRRSETTYDFAANFAKASPALETTRIDFGDGASRRFLLDGWSADETWQNPQTTMTWGVGSSSRLIAWHFGGGDVTMSMRCLPIWFEPRQQSIRFVVNGKPLDRIPLAPGFQTYKQRVPASFLKAGVNEIRIDYGFASRGSSDPRLLAVAWDWIELSASRPLQPARAAGETIEMPSGSQLTYLAPVAPGCSLRVDAINAAHDVTVETSVAQSDEILPKPTILTPGRNVEIPLLAKRSGLAEITLASRPKTGTRDALPVTWTRPRIECPPDRDVQRDRQQAAPRNAKRPNVLIYLVDTLRADHLGVYGYARGTSPSIDRFARDSVVFTNAIAQSGWTKTSVASILTGLVPFRHGALDRNDGLPPSIPTLPMMLAGAGYARFAAVSNGNVSPKFGFDRGFSAYRDLAAKDPERGVVASVIVDAFEQWLQTRNPSQPFFAYLHTIDPHDPYAAPGAFAKKFATVTDLTVPTPKDIEATLRARPDLDIDDIRADFIAKYDAEIVYTDAMFGRAMEDLKRRGLYDSTLILFTSDHGEEFLEHGHWGHGHTLYHELLHVPLIVKYPGGRFAGTVVDANVQHVDIAPTVLEAAGVAAPPKLDGQPLMDAETGPERRILSYLRMDAHDVMSAVYGHRQYIMRNASSGHAAEELIRFAPSTSERERIHLAQSELWRNELRKTLWVSLRQSRAIQAPQLPLEGELADQLRALGYLQ